MNNEATRVEFAERQGWKKIPGISPLDNRTPIVLWKRPIGGVVAKEPNPTDHNHAHTALMGMSEEEWDLFERAWYCLEHKPMFTFSVRDVIKTPLPTIVSCYLEATKGRNDERAEVNP